MAKGEKLGTRGYGRQIPYATCLEIKIENASVGQQHDFIMRLKFKNAACLHDGCNFVCMELPKVGGIFWSTKTSASIIRQAARGGRCYGKD